MKPFPALTVFKTDLFKHLDEIEIPEVFIARELTEQEILHFGLSDIVTPGEFVTRNDSAITLIVDIRKRSIPAKAIEERANKIAAELLEARGTTKLERGERLDIRADVIAELARKVPPVSRYVWVQITREYLLIYTSSSRAVEHILTLIGGLARANDIDFNPEALHINRNPSSRFTALALELDDDSFALGQKATLQLNDPDTGNSKVTLVNLDIEGNADARRLIGEGFVVTKLQLHWLDGDIDPVLSFTVDENLTLSGLTFADDNVNKKVNPKDDDAIADYETALWFTASSIPRLVNELLSMLSGHDNEEDDEL